MFLLTLIFSLRESLSKLPGDTIVDIWTIINKEFLDHYNNDDGKLTFLSVHGLD